MKKLIPILLALALALSALGAAAAPKAASALVGEWIFYSRESDDPERNVPHEALSALREQGRDYAKEETLCIEADGWFKQTDFNGFERNCWTDLGDGTGSLVVNGETALLSVEDGLLVLRTSGSLTRYERAKTAEIKLGTTGYVIAIPVEYREGEVTDRERADDQIAYYFSDEHLMDFDVYQFSTEGRTLEEYAAAEAAEYGADEVESFEVNGITLARYYSEEAWEGGVYRVANVLFTAVDSFAELSFWLDGDDAEELADAIVQSLERRLEDDMPGVVLEKCEGDYFLDRYLVRGETGEVFEAEYFGFEELAPGDEVEISQRGAQDFSISKPFRWPSSKPAATPAPLYATADGVAIREVKVDRSGKYWFFQYTLYNTTDADKSFDPSPFVLRAADGTELKTAIALLSPDEVWANNRTSVSVGILDGDRIQPGDEIEVWYGGTYLETVTASEF